MSRYPADAQSKPIARDWQWAWWERALLGLVGVVVAVVGFWAAFALYFTFGLAFACPGSAGRNIAAGMVLGAAWAVVVSLTLLATVSLWRVCAGRRGLRSRSWIAVAVIVSAVTMTVVAVAVSGLPPQSPDCGPVDVYSVVPQRELPNGAIRG